MVSEALEMMRVPQNYEDVQKSGKDRFFTENAMPATEQVEETPELTETRYFSRVTFGKDEPPL